MKTNINGPSTRHSHSKPKVGLGERLKFLAIDSLWALIILSLGVTISVPMISRQGFGTIWAVGLLIGVLIKLPPFRWWPYFLIGLPGNFIGLMSADWPILAAAIRTVADIVLVLLFALWAKRKVQIPFSSPTKVVSYVTASILFGAIRTVMTFLADRADPQPQFDFWQVGTGVFLTTSIGLLVFTPLTSLIAGREFRDQISPRSGVAAFVGIFLILALVPYLFVGTLTNQFLGWFFIFIPLLVLIAITSHQWALSFGLFITSLAFSYATSFGFGPFIAMTGDSGTRPAALALQMFLVSVPAAVWILAAALEQNRLTNNELQKLVNFDIVTGSRSRNWLSNWGGNQDGSKGEGNFELGAVLIVDASEFRVVEENFGQKAADRLLVELSNEIKQALPEDFIIARPDGFRFIVMAPRDTEIFELDVVANQVLGVLAKERVVETMRISRNVSIGASKLYNSPNDLEGGMQMAERALKIAKSKGSGGYKLLVQDSSEIESELEIENELRDALDNQEFKIFVQPQFELSSRRVVGFEVLVRWFKGDKIHSSPDRYIPVMESSGLIKELGKQIQIQTFDLILKYRPLPGPLSINVSALEIESDEWFRSFMNRVEKYGIRPHELGLEITETTALTITEEVENRLLYLKKAGFAIHIDDFGTGYASIANISKIPASSLKLDKSFVDDIAQVKGKFEVVAAISRLARGLGMDTIAEGVETEAQVTRLLQAGWHIGQGYFFAKPAPPEEFFKVQSQIL